MWYPFASTVDDFVRTGVREYAVREDTTRRRHLAHSQISCATRPKEKAFGLYAGRVALDSMYAAPTTSINELPGIHDSAKHERGGAPYFVSVQNSL